MPQLMKVITEVKNENHAIMDLSKLNIAKKKEEEERKRRAEEERLRREEEARLEALRREEEARLEALRLETERRRKAEEARLEALRREEEARQEALRLEAERIRREAEERRRAEEERRLAELKRIESEKLEKEERLRRERLVAEEAERRRKEEEARVEAERKRLAEAERLEKLRREEVERLEKMRREEEERMEKLRREEAERKKKEEDMARDRDEVMAAARALADRVAQANKNLGGEFPEFTGEGKLVDLARKIGELMKQMSIAAKNNDKPAMIRIAQQIAALVKEIITQANEQAKNCTDPILADHLIRAAQSVSSFSIQLKIIAAVKAAVEGDKSAKQQLVRCAQGLCNGVVNTVNAAESAALRDKDRKKKK